MKILYLHQHFALRDGATGTRSYEFARLLRQRGHEITILCGRSNLSGFTSRSGGWIQLYEIDSLRIIQLNVPYSQKMGNVKRLLSFGAFVLIASWLALRQRTADIIFATSTPLTIAVPAIVASFVNRCPFVFEVRDLWPEVPVRLGVLRNRFLIAMARLLERVAYRRASHIIACSPGMKEGILKAGVPSEKVTVVSNACDTGLFDVPPEEGFVFRARHSYLVGRPLVVYTGAFGKVNGLDYLVRLAHRVYTVDRSIAFLLVGDGREKARIRDLAQQLGILEKNFWIMDSVPRRSIPRILSAADFATSTVIPNEILWHNSANKFFDALAAGRPIAINHGGWLADLLHDSKAGIVLDPFKLDAAATQLISALKDPTFLKNARSSAKKLAVECFSRERLAQLLESVLLVTISGGNSATNKPISRHVTNFIKRALDLQIAFLALTTLAPLLAAVSLLVRAKLGSPVLFHQKRPGLYGHPFTLLKFRTMIDTCDTHGKPLPDKDRLTSFGQFLRSTSLDELPEILNVLRGEMSIVGPRPLLLEYLPRYTAEQARRHDVKPGITGWAQVNGRNAITWEQKFTLDVWYVDNWSLWLDFKIIILTLWKVIRREGINQPQHATMPEFLGKQ